MARPDTRTSWLVGPLFMALLPHALFLPAWLSTAALLGMAWRLSPVWRKDGPLQKRLRLVLVLAGMAAVFFQYHTLFGAQGGVSLLVLLAVLKLLESEGRRDQVVITLAGYFLLMTVLIHDQRLPVAAWLVLTMIVQTAALVATRSTEITQAKRALRQAAVLLLQGLPLALLLFVLFPRLHTPFGGLIRTDTASTGLSDNMSPGSISKLHQSNALAFRADFGTTQVDGRRLYWRGPVLGQYDGRSWRRGHMNLATPVVSGLGRPIESTVTLEPSHTPWLLVTGYADKVDVRRARETSDLEWLARQPVDQRLRYTVHAWQDYRLDPVLDQAKRTRALQLPAGSNPQTVALGQRWRAEFATPQAIVNAALAYFRNEPFYYTLNPPPLGEDAIDDFMFTTRRGFCEHYAAAFTVLMRAAGIPARVVTGYLGGEYNALGNFWNVRQRDAHAWAEVWLAGQGWTRVDPTAAIAPNRIEADAVADAAEPAPVAIDLPSTWLRPVRQAWDFIDNGWNQWVIGYDFERQRRTLNALSPSLANLRSMLWTLVLGAVLLVGGLAWYLFRPSWPAHADPTARLYARFLRKLAAAGLNKGQAEGAASFAKRAAWRRPDLAPAILAITQSYVGLRYGVATPDELTQLRHQVGAFKAKRQKHR